MLSDGRDAPHLPGRNPLSHAADSRRQDPWRMHELKLRAELGPLLRGIDAYPCLAANL